MNDVPASRWPADFNVAEFERQAKLNFERLQAANDAGDASTLRDFLTPELYRELEAEMKSAWGAQQKTESIGLQSEVLDVVTESVVAVFENRANVRGLRFTYEPEYLRFFQAMFEPV